MRNLDLELKNSSPGQLFHQKSWLQRLFESDIFNISLAMQYLFSVKEAGITSYLGNRLFKFSHDEVDFYIPQLITMYINMNKVADAICPYILERCGSSIEFSLECHWLLQSYGLSSMPASSTLLQYFSNLISDSNSNNFSILFCAELDFINELMNIGHRLKEIPTKEEKSKRLIHELYMLNFKLPSRVWLPLYAAKCPHLVLRIPYTAGCVLNSKDKAPYCMYVEVLEVDDFNNLELPKEILAINLDKNKTSLSLSSSALNLSDTVKKSTFTMPTSSCSSSSLCENIKSLDKNLKNLSSDVKENASDEEVVEQELTFFDSVLSKNIECSTSKQNVFEDSTVELEKDVLIESLSITENVIDLPATADVLDNTVPNTSESLNLSPSTSTSALSSVLLLSPKSQRRRRQQIDHTSEDPSASTMSEPWEEKEARIRRSSPYGHLPNWRLMAVIVKTGDDLRQELLAYQLLTTLKNIWEEENIPLYVRPYRIFICSHNSGLIEPIPNACSLHQIKKNLTTNPRLDDAGQPYPPTLLSHFLISYGSRLTKNFMRAQENFVRSCAAYCLVCYFLQVKDRHNGNILLDHDGHLIHIDFGYILSMSPRNLGFETSPFKLTQELIDVMFGMKSEMYAHFKWLMLQGLVAARKHHERLINIVEIMISGSQLPCFRGGPNVLRLMRDRFHVNFTDIELHNLVDLMVEQSRDSLTTRLYDNFQYYSNGIF